MSVPIEVIEDKQRIIFYGEDAKKHVELASKILAQMSKSHDVIYEGESPMLTNAPMVLIENQADHIAHHILIVGMLDDNAENLKGIADATPKAGCIVFEDKPGVIRDICDEDRADVIKMTYKKEGDISNYSGSQVAAVRSLLNRIRVPDEEFNKAIELLK